MTEEDVSSSINRLAESIGNLALQTSDFSKRMGGAEKARRRSNLWTYTLLAAIIAGAVYVGYVSMQARNLASDLKTNSENVAAIGASPQGAAVTNRKFIYTVSQCQKVTTTLTELDKCVGSHINLQYKCGQDAKDLRICSPLDLTTRPQTP